MIVVVDTNIVFSGLLNAKGTISDLLLNSENEFDFYAPSFILEELNNHRQKLVSLSGLSFEELEFLKRIVFKKIDLIDLESISESHWLEASRLSEDIDKFDTPFVALSLELEAYLWTGDKKLINGLLSKGVDWVYDTNQIIKIRNKE